MIAQSLFSDEDMIFAMWASKALRSLGSSAVNAAMRTDSGSRICSKIASRSETSTGRSVNCDMRTVLLVPGQGVRRGVGIVRDLARLDPPRLESDLGLGVLVVLVGAHRAAD